MIPLLKDSKDKTDSIIQEIRNLGKKLFKNVIPNYDILKNAFLKINPKDNKSEGYNIVIEFKKDSIVSQLIQDEQLNSTFINNIKHILKWYKATDSHIDQQKISGEFDNN